MGFFLPPRSCITNSQHQLGKWGFERKAGMYLGCIWAGEATQKAFKQLFKSSSGSLRSKQIGGQVSASDGQKLWMAARELPAGVAMSFTLFSFIEEHGLLQTGGE